MKMHPAVQTLQQWRERLARLQGDAYWIELEAAGRDRKLRAAMRELLPELGGFWEQRIDRRRMLQLLGSCLALAGTPACTRSNNEKLAPYTVMPEGMVPGVPQIWATSLCRSGYAHGVLVKTHMGRPIKVDGNPLHPASLGGSDAHSQAAALELFDPDRSRACTRSGNIVAWSVLQQRFTAARARWMEQAGEGLAILTGNISSPTARRQLDALGRALPRARWYQHEPVDRDAVLSGGQLAFGRPVEPIYDFAGARIIVALDADFLSEMPGHLRYAREFAATRRAEGTDRTPARLYALSSAPSLVGAVADHVLLTPPSLVEHLARGLAAKLGVLQTQPARSASAEHDAWLNAAANDLLDHRGSAIVLVGDHQAAAVHAIAHAINQRLGNLGRTVRLIEPITSAGMGSGGLVRLSAALEAREIEALLVLETNPAYSAPADVSFIELLRRVPFALHSGLYADETAAACEWHAPALHAFESWSDARAFDGSASLLQPLIEPLYEGHGIHQWLDLVTAGFARAPREQVWETWQAHFGASAAQLDMHWHESLANGVVAATQARALDLQLREDWQVDLPEPSHSAALELRLMPDASVWDGRYANSAWRQELPRPLTSLTWSNALLISERLAQQLEVRSGDHLTLAHAGRRLTAPAWISAEQPEKSMTLALGYGRERAGRIGSHLGVNAYRLRTSTAPWILRDVAVHRDAGHTALASVQHHHDMHGRKLVRQMTLTELAASGRAPRPDGVPSVPPSIYPQPQRHGRYAWGMTIDLSACIGCGVCTIACQAENNIPAVGAEQVRLGREMHWIRVDSYRSTVAGSAVFQPVPCMHCELAPCEYVCPVEAAIHDSEGLNLQIYNRCIGTRDCSQNCPYKVRRFNWLDFNGYEHPEPLAAPAAVMNPEVTVRSRGVMEKCTYCVQRISRARIEAKVADREIAPQEVIPACAAACPTHAIAFGDLQQAASEVSRWRSSPRHYVLLEELGTRPRTTYLAALHNPSPELERAEREATPGTASP